MNANGSQVLQTLVSQGPFVAGAVFMFLAFARGWLVSGREYDQMRRERDRYRGMAEHLVKAAQRAARVAEKATER